MTFFIIAALAILVTLYIVRTCFNPLAPVFIKNVFCGDLGRIPGPLTWLRPEHISRVYSLISEETAEINQRADKLVDGDSDTEASVRSQERELDYVIEFLEPYEIKKVEIVWGNYGRSQDYINRWSLQVKLADQSWREIAGQDKTPKEPISLVRTDTAADSLRIRAASDHNLVGIYEVKILGRPR